MYIIVLVVIAVALSFVRDTFAWRGGFTEALGILGILLRNIASRRHTHPAQVGIQFV